MADKLSICNAALGELAKNQLTALDDDSVEAEYCDAQFDLVRDAVLAERSCAWRFARGRHSLPADATAPTFGWTYRYLLPSEVIQVLELDEVDDELWELEGRYILTDQAAPIRIRTVDRIEDVSVWPPGFVTAMTTRLSAVLCVPLTEDATHMRNLWALYARQLADAATANAREGAQGESNTDAIDAVNAWRA